VPQLDLPSNRARITSDMPAPKPIDKISINQLIIDQLAHGELRMLALVVALRKTLGKSAYLKRDLSSVVVIALRKLVATKVVRDSEGTYSLNQDSGNAPK
jgi:hypothetical protein